MPDRLSHQTPIARRDRLVTTELADEVVLYDTTTNQLHSLNPTAAFVWQRCDGRTPVADIAHQFGPAFGVEQAEDLVWSALDQLADQGLLVGETARPEWVAGISRRDLMKRAAVTALVLVPLVRSLVAPTPAAAQSPGTTTIAPTTTGTTPSLPTIGRFWLPPQSG